jgi:diguanylate cyclase (GGDEF)-like protein/PAS domain S-box-containing protein
MSVRTPDDRIEFEARLLGAIGQPVIATDTDFKIVYWNRGAEVTLGYRRDEVVGTSVFDTVGLDFGEARVGRLSERLASGELQIREFVIKRKDESPLPVLVMATPILDDAAELMGIVIVGTDITERKDVEETMAKLSAIVESSRDAIIGIDLKGDITSWNAAAEQLFERKAADMIGSNVRQVADKRLRREVQSVFETLTTGRVVEAVPFVRRRDDGTAIHIEPVIYPVRSPGGELMGAAVIARDVTVRLSLERLAAEEHRRLEEAQRIAKVGSFEFEFEGNKSNWSRELRHILGVPAHAPQDYRTFLSRVHPDDYDEFLLKLGAWIGGTDRFLESEFRVMTDADDVRYVAVRIEAVRDDEGIARSMVGSLHDLTDQRAVALARQRAEEQFAVAFDLGRVGMMVTDPDRVIMRANAAFCELIGRPRDDVIGHRTEEFEHPSEIADPHGSLTERLVRSDAHYLDAEVRFLRPDGVVVHAEAHLSAVRDSSGETQYLFGQMIDITDRKRVEDELQRLAMHDPLTGLPNRYLLQDRLETALARARRANNKVVVLFVDVDHFKLVNDSLGHSTGDTLLVQLSTRLARLSRAGDTVARFGGDEFVVVCEGVSDASEADAIGQRLLKLFDEPFLIGDQQLYVTVSAGVFVVDADATPVTVLRDADAAMYQAKDRGRARAEMYDETLRHRAAKRLDIEMMLRHALERDEFRIAYQPVVSLPGDVSVGVEALLRWEHPERGTLSPTEFVPAAEETGLIVPIGMWVLEASLRQLATWRKELSAADTLFVAVNLSPRQLLSGDLHDRCRDAIADNSLSPDALCLEITEGAVMTDVDVSIPILRKIADSGIGLAVDDFGSGYSSLSYLKRLPVSTLKIDRSFVDGLGHDPDDSSIVRAIVSLGYALGLELCAEGVETPAQRAELVGLGCHIGQGHFWAPAMRPEAFAEWYERRLATLPSPV